MALTAASASAFPAPRTFATQITGFPHPSGLTVDFADHPWVGDSDSVLKYEPYPSLGELPGLEHAVDFGVTSLALDSVNGDLYVTESNALQNDLYIFENGTGPLLETRQIGSTGTYSLGVVTDNSTGRIYISDESSVQALGPTNAPHDFTFSPPGSPGEYDYISGNEITGTPDGPFVEPWRIAIDTEGNIYEVNRGKAVIDEFAPSGEFIREFTGFGAPGGFTREIPSVAVDPTTGNVLVSTPGGIDEFDPFGGYLNQMAGTGAALAFDSSGDLYVNPGREGSAAAIEIFTPNSEYPTLSYRPISGLARDSVTLNASLGPNGGGPITECKFEYGPTTSYGHSEPCLNGSDEPVGTVATPIESEPPTEVHADLIGKLHGNTAYHYHLVLTNKNGTLDVADREFETPPAITALKTLPATEVTNESAALHASFTEEEGIATEYFFEYGTTTNYGHQSPVPPGEVLGIATGPQSLSAPVAGLVSNTTYHYRIVAQNIFGTTIGEDATFLTFRPPTIDAFSSSGVTATSAILHARINPQGFETSCRFEYGTTNAYGQSEPCSGPLSGTTGQPAEVELENLQRGVTYHFRVSAENKWGVVTSEDQTFEFFPPTCPNRAVRQQTGSSYLPDCRAYELASPKNAEGTLLFAGGPNTGQATSPSRFSFTGSFGSLPGTNTINTAGDLYVATRTNTGWVSRYIGLPGNQAGCMGGPPTSPSDYQVINNAPWLTNTVLADPSLGRLLNFSAGAPLQCAAENNGTADADAAVDIPSNAPYLWSADGTLLSRLPSGVEGNTGALEALECPYKSGSNTEPRCTGETTASADLGHLVFSSRSLAFAPGGLTVAPGSAYDDDLTTGTLTLISTLKKNGQPIPQDPAFATAPPYSSSHVSGGSEEFIRFPAVSSDGSHILMSTATQGTGIGTCQGGYGEGTCQRFIDAPVHLYMSVDDEPAVEVSQSELTHEDAAVRYVGMTEDGTKVYFTSEQHLTAEDPAHEGASLYMWSQQGEEQGHPLTLVSKANPGSAASAGNTGSCQPALVTEPGGIEVPWTSKCGIEPYSSYPYSTLGGGAGGNGISDTGIASRSGDIYFYSPEQLDGDHGILGQQNLYDYREGELRFVATLAPEHHCRPRAFATDPNSPSEQICAAGPVVRIDVSSDGAHMAFLTASRLTSYENAGHLEMYSYTPSTGAIVCDSCRPDGQPATSDVQASEDGLFMTNDGRAFFSTTEPLVSRDTNHGVDVYEFVDGRPQLITPGTGTATSTESSSLGKEGEISGLVGVSANGTDVYFATFDALVAEDQNGNFFRFYDARTNGGFPEPPPTQPCAAAEECHGPGTEAPQLPTQGTAAALTGGNATSQKLHRHHKKHKRIKHRRNHNRALHNHRNRSKK